MSNNLYLLLRDLTPFNPLSVSRSVGQIHLLAKGPYHCSHSTGAKKKILVGSPANISPPSRREAEFLVFYI